MPARKSSSTKRSTRKTVSRKTACRRKTASRKKTACRKTACCRTPSRTRSVYRSAYGSRSLGAACPLSRSLSATGRCGTVAPCIDQQGNILPYATRGADGNCRVSSCGPRSIMNPETGRCISTATVDGRALAMAKKYDDAKRFVDIYKKTLDINPEYQTRSYYDSFNGKDYGSLGRTQRLADEQLRVTRSEAIRAEQKKRLDKSRQSAEFNRSFNTQKKGIMSGLTSLWRSAP